MNRCIASSIRFWCAVTLIGLFYLAVRPAAAMWLQIMQENFEQPSSSWSNYGAGPWTQPPTGAYARQWQVRPNHPWQNNLPPHWGIQNRVFRLDPGSPQLIQAAWCDASTDDSPNNGAGRDPEFDTYRNSNPPGPINTIMYWGPIDCRRTAGVVNLRAQFDWVSNCLVGDTFTWEASPAAGTGNQPIDPTYYPTHWFRAGYSTGDFHQTWHTNTFRVDSLDSAGTIISLVGRQQVWVGWRFRTTNTELYTNHPDVQGSFVDNVKIAFDDGLFNLDAIEATRLHWPDLMPLPYPQVLDTMVFRFIYTVAGNGIMRDSLGNPISAHITCTINNAPFWDTSVVVNAGPETSTDTLYTPRFIPQIENTYYVRWMIDPDSLLRESSHGDNGIVDSFYVTRPNSPPTVNFIAPDSLLTRDTVTISHPQGVYLYPIVVHVYDEDDAATWYMYDSQDTAVDTRAAIQTTPSFPWTTHDDPSINDTVWVNLGALDDGVYHFWINANDVIHSVWGEQHAVIQLVTTSANEHVSLLPTKSGLYQTYPNPFNADVTFKIGLAEHGNGELRIYDVMGREVDRLSVPGSTPGWYNVHWRPTKLASGVYFTQFWVRGNVLSTVKLMYLK